MSLELQVNLTTKYTYSHFQVLKAFLNPWRYVANSIQLSQENFTAPFFKRGKGLVNWLMPEVLLKENGNMTQAIFAPSP